MLTDEALEALEPATRALDESQAAAERALGAAQAAIQAALDRRDELEGKIASYRTMQEQRRQRLEWVRGAKEASTLMAELDLARSVLAKEEAEFMRSGDAVSEAERRAAEAEQAPAQLRAQQAAEREGLAGQLHIPEPLAALLVQRGLAAPDVAKAFLRPELERLSDPLAWVDMPVAAELVARAVRTRTPILVHGDYDVDGQCAAALLTRVLRSVGGTAHAFVPHRLRDGYDFGPAGLAMAQRVSAGLIITCDCGITAVDAVRAARAAGIEVIVTDHHLPGDELPPASAVLDPRRRDCPSQDKDLCGAGVAFKLAQALMPALGQSSNLPLHFLDYVALATVADVVPLVGENRILVRHGLKMLADSRWTGLRALVEVAGLAGRPIKSGHVGFILAPRLNAAGRIGEPADGLRLLLSAEPARATAIARELETLNARRQELDQRILDEALELAEATLAPDDRALVLAADGWHPGGIGIGAP